MEIAFFLVALATAVLAVTALADRIEIPAPLVLIVGGVVASYVPGVPTVHLESDVVLLGLLPPLLYATAISTSLVDFNTNRRPILLLSVGLVVFTAAGVACVVKAILPGIEWWEAFAIGAVVAPPDAVAASAIARRIGLPRRVVTILEGESLFNDATALVTLRTAVAAAGTLAATGEGASETFHAWRVAIDFVLAAGGGVLVGLAVFKVVAWLRRRINDPILDTAASFVIPFAAYVAAEAAEASGVIAVVVAGLLLGHKAPVLQSAQSRIAERTNWRTIAFVLENAVFLLIGLQARWILEDVSESTLGTGRIVAVCGATLLACMVLRMVWVFPARYLLVRPGPDPSTGAAPPWPFTFILGWAGMRGVVTLAAAFVIPTEAPYREVLLLVAFTVVAGTLFVQGLSLGWVARRLAVPAPDPMEDALARANLLQQASNAGWEALQRIDHDPDGGVKQEIKSRLERRNFAAWERLGTVSERESPSAEYARVRSEMIDAERLRVLQIRSSGQVASQVVSQVLGMLDVEESMLDYSLADEMQLREGQAVSSFRRVGETCDDLDRFGVVDTAPEPVCRACLDEGTRWVALRECLTCGNVACCDSSPRRHATAHFHDTTHPVMESAEPGEDWRWCYVHHLTA